MPFYPACTAARPASRAALVVSEVPDLAVALGELLFQGAGKVLGLLPAGLGDPELVAGQPHPVLARGA